MGLLLTLLTSLVGSLVLTDVVRRIATRFGLVDRPDARRLHNTPVPRLGGLAILLAVVFTMYAVDASGIWPDAFSVAAGDLNAWHVLVVGLGMGTVGTIDDIHGLRPRLKLWLTIGIAFGAWLSGFRVGSIAAPYVGAIPLGIFSMPFTVLWIAGVSHAFNLVDGLDGLAGGLAVIALGAIGLAGYLSGNQAAVMLSLTLGGTLLGFLYFNSHPARIFMGDTGSLAVGGMLAMLALDGSGPSQSGVSFGLFPVLVIAYPLVDTALAIVRRWARGVHFNQADRRHIHHQVLLVGRGYQWTVNFLFGVAAVIASTGLLFQHGGREMLLVVAVGTFLGGAILLWGLARFLHYHELLAAGSSVVSVVLSAREVLREKIFVRDYADRLPEMEDLNAVSLLLEDVATKLGLQRIEVLRGRSTGDRARADDHPNTAVHWRLDWPLLPDKTESAEPLVLRIWGDRESGLRPHTAGRVAAVLGVAVEQWLTRHPEYGLQRHAFGDDGATSDVMPSQGTFVANLRNIGSLT